VSFRQPCTIISQYSAEYCFKNLYVLDYFVRSLIHRQSIVYERTILISFSSWYWIDSVPSKPGKNFRIPSFGEEGHVKIAKQTFLSERLLFRFSSRILLTRQISTISSFFSFWTSLYRYITTVYIFFAKRKQLICILYENPL